MKAEEFSQCENCGASVIYFQLKNSYCATSRFIPFDIDVQEWLDKYYQVPDLTKSEESELVFKIKEMFIALNIDEKSRTLIDLQVIAEGKKANERFLGANFKFAAKMAKKFQNAGVDYLELLEAGVVGLQLALSKFDPTRGYRFSTYAAWWITKANAVFIFQKAGTDQLSEIYKLKALKESMFILRLGMQSIGGLKSLEEKEVIARFCGIEIEELDALLKKYK